jgi:hypothetical protein
VPTAIVVPPLTLLKLTPVAIMGYETPLRERTPLLERHGAQTFVGDVASRLQPRILPREVFGVALARNAEHAVFVNAAREPSGRRFAPLSGGQRWGLFHPSCFTRTAVSRRCFTVIRIIARRIYPRRPRVSRACRVRSGLFPPLMQRVAAQAPKARQNLRGTFTRVEGLKGAAASRTRCANGCEAR